MQNQFKELQLSQARLATVLSINTFLINRSLQLQAMMTQAKNHPTPPPASVIQSITTLQSIILKTLHGNLTYIAKVTEVFAQIEKSVDGQYGRNIAYLESFKPANMECPDNSVKDLLALYGRLQLLFSQGIMGNSNNTNGNNSNNLAGVGNGNPQSMFR